MTPVTPRWVDTPSGSPIRQIALPVASHVQGHWYASGTAVAIAPYLAMTAAHVVADHYERSERKALVGAPSDSFHLYLLQTTDNGAGIVIWEGTQLWLSSITDIAFIGLRHFASNVAVLPATFIRLDLLPPPIGSRVVAFGYHSSLISLRDPSNPLDIHWHDEGATSVGEVVEIHPRQRDAARLNFPCFRTNARFDAGMSGGVVTNDLGRACGVICSSLPAGEPGQDDVSYAATLYAAMGTRINLSPDGAIGGPVFPVVELARQHRLHALHHEFLTVTVDQDNDRLETVWSGPSFCPCARTA
ncbi:MAG: S1 family peptidase [Gemmatimonadaceae bacterium]